MKKFTEMLPVVLVASAFSVSAYADTSDVKTQSIVEVKKQGDHCVDWK